MALSLNFDVRNMFNLKCLKCNFSEVLNKINDVEALLIVWRPLRNTELGFNLVQSLFNHFWYMGVNQILEETFPEQFNPPMISK